MRRKSSQRKALEPSSRASWRRPSGLPSTPSAAGPSAIARSTSWSKSRRASAGSGAQGSRCVNCLIRATATRSLCCSAAVLDPAPVAVRDPEPVARLADDALDVHLVDVDRAHGQRVGERVKEAGRVPAADVHDRPSGGRVVVERDRERRQRCPDGRVGRVGALARRGRQRLGEPPVFPLARLLDPPVAEQPGQLQQLALEHGGVGCRTLTRDHPEDVHDLP